MVDLTVASRDLTHGEAHACLGQRILLGIVVFRDRTLIVRSFVILQILGGNGGHSGLLLWTIATDVTLFFADKATALLHKGYTVGRVRNRDGWSRPFTLDTWRA